jgi:hypothetical protein
MAASLSTLILGFLMCVSALCLLAVLAVIVWHWQEELHDARRLRRERLVHLLRTD